MLGVNAMVTMVDMLPMEATDGPGDDRGDGDGIFEHRLRVGPLEHAEKRLE